MKVQTLSYIYKLHGTHAFGSLYYVLKSFCDEIYPDNDIEWCEPIYSWESPQQCVDIIMSREIDMLLVPMYVWTDLKYIDVCKELKKRNNYIKIVGGGPNISGKIIESNFERYPFFDAVVYGDGEEAFYQLCERYKETNELSAGLNCATPNEHGFYKRFRYEDYKPYLIFTGKSTVKQFKKDIKNIPEEGKRLLVNWETDRGCPFGCSFCDWNAGLHHKVTQKDINIIMEELTNFEKYRDEVKIIFNNANFGILKHDGKILDTLIEKKLCFDPGAWSKIKKDITYGLMEKFIEYDKQFINDGISDKLLSVQSIYADTLKDINRPDIPWEKHKHYIKRLADLCEEEPIKVELISDLPHMDTLRHVNQLIEFSKAGIQRVQYFQFGLLPNAPAFSLEWRNKWKYKEIKVHEVIYNVESLDDETIRNMTTEHLTFLYKGSIQNKIFNTLMHEYFNAYNGDLSKLDVHLDTLFALSMKIEKQIEQYKDKSGIFVWGVYLSHQKRWVSFRVALIELLPHIRTAKQKKELQWENKNEILELLSPKNLAA